MEINLSPDIKLTQRLTVGYAANNKIKANFKKGGSVVYQSVELLMNSTAEKKNATD